MPGLELEQLLTRSVQKRGWDPPRPPAASPAHVWPSGAKKLEEAELEDSDSEPVLTGVDGTGPPTGGRPRRETAAGWRRAKSDESATARSALDKGWWA